MEAEYKDQPMFKSRKNKVVPISAKYGKETSLSMIQLPGSNRKIRDFAIEIAHKLQDKDVYNFGNLCVIPSNDDASFNILNPHSLVSVLEKYFDFFTYTHMKTPEEIVMVPQTRSMNSAISLLVSESPDFISGLRKINKIYDIPVPTYDSKGKIKMLKKGYNKENSVYIKNDVKYKDIGLEKAKETLEELFEEFPFVKIDTGKGKNIAIASMLGLFINELLPPTAIRPCIFISSNSEGAGKTTLAKAITIPVLKKVAINPGTGNNEIRKTLLSMMITGKQSFVIDNVKGKVNLPALEAFITSSYYQDRLLGQSRMFEGTNETMVIITGNDAKITPDLFRRSLCIILHQQEENFSKRKFNNIISDETLLSRRPDILNSLYTLVNNWAKKSMPDPPCTNYSFPEWAKIVGGIMCCAGYEGIFLEPTAEGIEPDAEGVKTIVDWMAENPDEVKNMNDIYIFCKENELFLELMDEFAYDTKANRGFLIRMGKIMKRYTNRKVGDYTLMAKRKSRGKMQYFLVPN